MVIQCSACDTRFKISDDKVKSGPVKVRCSKCKEIFTVQPPEEEQIVTTEEAPATSAPETDSASSPSLDDVDWGSLNSDETDTTANESPETDEDVSTSDFSFGDDDESAAADIEFSLGDDEDAATEESQEFSFGDEETEPDSDDNDDTEGGISDFSFGDEETTEEEEEDEADSDDAFSFGGSTEATAEDFGFDEAVGEGAQDEFSFDDAPASTDDADDFDWDGGGAGGDDTDSGDEPGFGESSGGDGSLDFSSLEMEVDEPVEIEEPVQPAPLPVTEESRPKSVKGPQKGGGKGRKSGKRKKSKKKSGPLRSILILLLLIISIVGGGLFGLKEMGFWSGDFTELQTVDYETAAKTGWENVMTEINKLAGTEVGSGSKGIITVTEMAGRYAQNSSAGTLFVIDGTVRNDYLTNRSGTAVLGILYDEAGTPVRKQKAYCGNVLTNKILQAETLAEIQTRSDNPFGDSFSNDDVAPGALVPFTIVFSDLPDNLSTFNVEIAE